MPCGTVGNIALVVETKNSIIMKHINWRKFCTFWFKLLSQSYQWRKEYRPPIYLHWDFMKFWLSQVWNIQLDFFPRLNWEKIPVWNTKLAKSKIPVRVVKNVISKWTKMEFPRFPFLWFTAVHMCSGCSESTRRKAGNVYLCEL